MIRQFTFDGQTIRLPRSPVLTPKGESLFAADSMTLFVGVSGAGKTRALAALASIFSKKNRAKVMQSLPNGTQSRSVRKLVPSITRRFHFRLRYRRMVIIFAVSSQVGAREKSSHRFKNEKWQRSLRRSLDWRRGGCCLCSSREIPLSPTCSLRW